MEYEYILFDLDGTVSDSGIGITNSVMYALEKYGIETKHRSELYKFIGPPLWESFEKYCGFSKENSQKAVEYFREYYKDKGIFESSIYEGMEDLLKKLKDNGKILILATSKYEEFAKQILEHFNIAKYFSCIAGSNLQGTRVKKGDVIKYALESSNITNFSKTIMIGDREHDIIGAKDSGISSVGVLYGYGDRNELEKAGADFIATTVADISKILFI